MKIIYTNLQNDKFLHTIKIFDEEFSNVENIKKFSHCSYSNCKYYEDCHTYGIVRTFDCQKNANLVSTIYNIVTTAIVVFIFITIFFTYDLVSFKGLGILIASLVFLDILCTLIETNIEKIREKLFYNKLKRKSLKEKNLKEVQLSKKSTEELEKSKNNPNYKSVLEAETFVKSLKELSDTISFGPNNDKVNICVEKLIEIVDILKKDSSGYSRVAFLFEAYLPEFYNTLSFYSNFVRADAVKKEYEEILTKCVDKFLNFLSDQKIDAIFDQKSIEIQFKSTAETLGKMIDKGE